jgi:hypothetical protein
MMATPPGGIVQLTVMTAPASVAKVMATGFEERKKKATNKNDNLN